MKVLFSKRIFPRFLFYSTIIFFILLVLALVEDYYLAHFGMHSPTLRFLYIFGFPSLWFLVTIRNSLGISSKIIFIVLSILNSMAWGVFISLIANKIESFKNNKTT